MSLLTYHSPIFSFGKSGKNAQHSIFSDYFYNQTNAFKKKLGNFKGVFADENGFSWKKFLFGDSTLKKELPDIIDEARSVEILDSLKKSTGGLNDFLKGEKGSKLTESERNALREYNKTAEISVMTTDGLTKASAKLANEQAKVNKSFGANGLAGTLKNVGASLGSLIANIGTGLLIGAGIDLLFKGLDAFYDNTVNKSQHLIEVGEQARETIKGIKDEASERDTFMNQNTDRFVELRAGVNTETNSNISLTNDEYTEYLSLCDQIANIYPSLVQSFDAQGHAILDLGTDAEEATNKLKGLTEESKIAEAYKIREQLQDDFSGAFEEYAKANKRLEELEEERDNLLASRNTLDTAETIESTFEQIDSNLSGFEAFTRTFDIAKESEKDLAALARTVADELGVVTGINQKSTDGNIWGLTFESTTDNMEKFFDEYSNRAKSLVSEESTTLSNDLSEINAEIAKAQQDLANSMNQTLPSVISSLYTNETYRNLGSELQQMINNAVTDIDWTELGKTDRRDIYDYVESTFINPFTDILNSGNGVLQKAYNDLLTLDPTLAADEYQKEANDLLMGIRLGFAKIYNGDIGKANESTTMLSYLLGITDENGVLKTNEILTQLREILQGFNDEEWAKVAGLRYSMTLDQLIEFKTRVDDASVQKTPENIQKIAEEVLAESQEAVDSIKTPITFTSILKKTLGEGDDAKTFSEITDDFQSNISTIQTALDSLKAGQDINMTDLVQEFSNLAGVTDDVDKALSEEKVRLIQEYFKAWQGVSIGLDGNLTKEMQSFLENLLKEVDLSDVDISNVTSFGMTLTDLLKEELSEDESDIVDAYAEIIEAKNERVKELVGNVDVNHRPVIFDEDGNYNTILSETYNFSDFGLDKEGAFNVTPILPNGDKIENLKDYIQGIIDQGGDIEESNIFLGAYDNIKTAEDAAISLHEEQEDMYSDEAEALKALYALATAKGWNFITPEQEASFIELAKSIDLDKIKFEQYKDTVQDAITVQSNLTDAMSASVSASGLSAEQIQNVTNAFKDLDSFDPEKLFERTTSGVHLNAEEMERLNKEVQANQQADILQKIIAKQIELNRAQAQGKNTSAIQNEILSLQQLAAQYDGTISAYKRFQDAQSAPNERDSYEGVGAAYEEMQQLTKNGWWGDESLKEYVNLLLSAENQTGDMQKDWEKIHETIGDTGHNLFDYWMYDEDGHLDSAGLETFLKDVQSLLGEEFVWEGADGLEFDFSGDKLQKVADTFNGTTTELIQLFEKGLIDTDMAVDMGYSQYSESVNIAAEGVETLKQRIAELSEENPTVDISTVISGDEQIQDLAELFAGLPTEIQTSIGITTENAGDAEKIIQQLVDDPDSINLDVDDTDAQTTVDSLMTLIQNSKPTVTPQLDTTELESKLNEIINRRREITIYTNMVEKGIVKPGVQYPSDAQASGTVGMDMWNAYRASIGAYAYGNDWALNKDQAALVNELGNESIVRQGKWSIINGPAHVEHLKKGDIIFNAQQTKELLQTGRVISGGGHGRMAYANGTAYNMMNAYATLNRSVIDNGSGGFKSGTGTGTLKTLNERFNDAANNAADAADNLGNAANAAKDTAEKTEDTADLFDHIVERLDDLQQKTDNYIQDAENAVKLSTRLSKYQSAIGNIGTQIKTNQKAEKRYEKQAQQVVKDSNGRLTNNIIKKIRNGTIDITKYSGKTLEFIQDYENWYTKAEQCAQAVRDLKVQQQELAKTKLDAIVDRYDLILEKYDAIIDKNNALLDYRNAAGISNVSDAQKGTYQNSLVQEQSKYSYYQDALAKYQNELNKQMKAGLIKENSDAWREAQVQIENYNKALIESQTAMAELNENIRNIKTTKLQRALEKLESIGTRIASVFGLREKRGQNITEDNYMSQVRNNNDQIQQQYALLNDALEKMSGYELGSEKWEEQKKIVDECKESIISLLDSNEDLKASIVEERWEAFYKLHDQIDNAITELDYLKDSLLEAVDEVGNLTDDGYASIVLIERGITLQEQTIADYRTALEKLDQDYANGNITQEQYNEKQLEFQKIIQESASAVKDYKQELIDIWVTQAQTRNELLKSEIDLRKDALGNLKSYYDYAKSVKEKNTDIDVLKSQIAALEGVTEASGAARLAKLKADLADAQDDLDSTFADHSYDLKISGYDKLSEEADDVLDKVLKSVQTSTEAQQNVVNNMLNQISKGYVEAYDTINDVIEDSGVVLSQTTTDTLEPVKDIAQQIKDVAEATGVPIKEIQDLLSSEDFTNSIKSYGTLMDTAVKDKLADAKTASDALIDSLKELPTDKAVTIKVTRIITDEDSNGNKTTEAENKAMGLTDNLPSLPPPSNTGSNNSLGNADTTAQSQQPTANVVSEPKKMKTNANLLADVKTIINTGKSRSKKITASEQKEHHALWEYIVKNYGRTPTNAMYKQLAKVVGVKMSKTPTSTEKNTLFTALKNIGFSSGGLVEDGRYIPASMMDIVGKAIVKNGDNALISAHTGEYVLNQGQTDKFLELMKPAIDTMSAFNELGKSPMLSGIQTSPVNNVSFDAVIKVMGNVDRDVYGDIEELGKQLIKSGSFTEGMTKAIGRKAQNDGIKTGIYHR